MTKIHPFTEASYERTDAGVRVVHRGKEGLFNWDGRWISGALRQADPNMCIFVAGGYGGKMAGGAQRGASGSKSPVVEDAKS